MERNASGLAELLTVAALFLSPILYDLSQWVQRLLNGG